MLCCPHRTVDAEQRKTAAACGDEAGVASPLVPGCVGHCFGRCVRRPVVAVPGAGVTVNLGPWAGGFSMVVAWADWQTSREGSGCRFRREFTRSAGPSSRSPRRSRRPPRTGRASPSTRRRAAGGPARTTSLTRCGPQRAPALAAWCDCGGDARALGGCQPVWSVVGPVRWSGPAAGDVHGSSRPCARGVARRGGPASARGAGVGSCCDMPMTNPLSIRLRCWTTSQPSRLALATWWQTVDSARSSFSAIVA